MSRVSRKELFGGGSDGEDAADHSYAGYENLFAFEEIAVDQESSDTDDTAMVVTETTTTTGGDAGDESEEEKAPEFTFNLFSGAPETVVVEKSEPVMIVHVDRATESMARAKATFNDEYAEAAREKFRSLAYYFTFAEPEAKRQDLASQFELMAVDGDAVRKIGGVERYDVPSKVLCVNAHNEEVDKANRRSRPGKKRRQLMRESKVQKAFPQGTTTREYGVSRQYGSSIFDYGGEATGMNQAPLGRRGGLRGRGRGRGGRGGRGGSAVRGRGRGN